MYQPPSFVDKNLYRKGQKISAISTKDINRWIDYIDEQAFYSRTNNILILWGDDFAHFDANLTFNALDFIQDNI